MALHYKNSKISACGGPTLLPVKISKNSLLPVIRPETPPPPGGLAIGKGSTLYLKISPFASTFRHDVSPMGNRLGPEQCCIELQKTAGTKSSCF